MSAVPEPPFDEGIHPRYRLHICSLLRGVGSVSFAVLCEALDVADYVLSKHLKVLSEAGYVSTTKQRALGRPTTWVQLTATGEQALTAHLAALEQITGVSPTDG